MSAIGASIGYFCTCACTLVTIKKDKDGTPFLKIMAVVGLVFSIAFMVLQLIPIPGLEGVHFGKESYILLIVWVVLGVIKSDAEVYLAFFVRKGRKSRGVSVIMDW